jgi:hypothetical protein
LNTPTTYHPASDDAVIKRGACVTVWYGSAGDIYPVVDEVRCLGKKGPRVPIGGNLMQ